MQHSAIQIKQKQLTVFCMKLADQTVADLSWRSGSHCKRKICDRHCQCKAMLCKYTNRFHTHRPTKDHSYVANMKFVLLPV